MISYKPSEIIITGLGVTSAIGQGKNAFISALLQGNNHFDVMKRPGRQVPIDKEMKGQLIPFFGAEISNLALPKFITKQQLRTASFSTHVALATLNEAWHEAQLDDIAPERIGLIVGGSNFQQRELMQIYATYQNRVDYIRPSYGMSFMDTDLCGSCTEIFGIKGFSYTLGGASASGQIAVIQAINAVQSGQVDVCIAMGVLMDLSYWECQGFRSLGAMGSNRYAHNPELACRPFDTDRDGFIYGEACGAVVIQKSDLERCKEVVPYAQLKGWAMGMDGNRYTSPSLEGEMNVIRKALQQAQFSGTQIDYINPHGTGSIIGDAIELDAIAQCGLRDAYINATKSIIGHSLSAAGTVELIATLLQMKIGKLHSSRNLDNPINRDFNWVNEKVMNSSIKNTINLSLGFGGINSAIVLQKL